MTQSKVEKSNNIPKSRYEQVLREAGALRADTFGISARIQKRMHANDNFPLTSAQRKIIQDAAQVKLQELMDVLMIDRNADHNSEDTPYRVAKMLVNETFRGRYHPAPKLTSFPNVTKLDQIYVVGPIDVKSVCAHHWQPFIGSAWIGVLPFPDGKLIGLSKFNRVVDWYSRRGQIQEELTQQITDHLTKALNPRGIGVLVKAQHLCMLCRGVNQNTSTITCVLEGEMRDSASVKQEFLTFVNMLPKG